MPSVLDKRLVLVTGKGGVGKTTVSAALGLLAAGRGKRTMLCEVAEQERMPRLFGAESVGHRELQLAPRLFGMSISPDRAKEEWLHFQLRSSTVAGMLGQSRLFQYLTAAAPGLTELVTIGKVWELAQLDRVTEGAAPYDLVIVDAPATGHGLAMLRAPQTFAGVARVGPVRRQALKIHAFVCNPEVTGVLAVATPEEIPVNETLELGERMREEVGLDLDAVLVNGVYPERFSAEEARLLRSVDGNPSPSARAALRAALSEYTRAGTQRSQLRRLRRGTPAPVATLPYLFAPAVGRPELEELARELDRRL
ncbi:MAG TPA: ArsA family ATPase [Thermoleophilaceae bacterium]|nr:ArsA family ATPase [Thermoleophilaceae bacterium]